MKVFFFFPPVFGQMYTLHKDSCIKNIYSAQLFYENAFAATGIMKHLLKFNKKYASSQFQARKFCGGNIMLVSVSN